MRKNKNNKSTFSIAEEATGNVKRECRRQKIQTPDSCFASKKGRCSILRVSKCAGSSCGFYKTEEQYKEGRKKVFERIKTFDKEFQKDISKTYYGGKRPWIKGGDK